MEKKLVSAFDQAVMPESCARRIENKLAEKSAAPSRYEEVPMAESRFGWLAPVAAVLALVLAVGFVLPRMQQATDALAEVPAESEAKLGETEYSEEVLQVMEELESGLRYKEGRVAYSYVPNEDGVNWDNAAFWDTGAYHTPFTDCIDGRVYFIANGENIDITDQFSPEKPFTYIYTDRKLITHYIAIGDTPDNTGYFEITQKSWDTSMYGQMGGVGGKYWFRGEDDSWQCPWLLKAREIFEPYGIYFIV